MVLNTAEATGLPVEALAIDQGRLLAYLRSTIPGLETAAEVGVRQFSHGQSNPTYLVQVGPRRLVLRKKPPGRVLASAHAVDREARVLSALEPTAVPVPRVLATCANSSVLGTPFYVMEHVAGRIFTDPACPELAPAERKALYRTVARTLAALHSVRPEQAGLQDYGPQAHYCKRQVARWSRQYASQLRGPPLPEMTALASWLEGHIPQCDSDASATRISHGDFRLDNMVVHPTDSSRILAVLDWELSTLGHPWADLAYLCMPYHLPRGIPGIPVLPSPPPPGVPAEAELVAEYCSVRGVPPPDPVTWAFFMALSLYRIAAILAGVGARAKQGNASSRNAAQVGSGASITSLCCAALQLISRAEQQPAAAPSAGHQDGAAACAACACTGARETGQAMSAASGFDPSPRVQPLITKLKAFMEEHICPAEAEFNSHATGPHRWQPHTTMERLKAEAKAQGLWNLWLPAEMARAIQASLGPDEPALAAGRLQLGAGLSNVEYAFLSEIMGRTWWASEVFNSSAPDTGNMEVLARYGTQEQQRRWLLPLLDGSIRSCFAMTEPDVASSDATNIGCSIVRQGDSYVICGRKWWTSGAMDPRCRVAIVMGKTDPSNPQTHKQQSMVLVPMDTPGLKVVRPLQVFGYDDAPHGHAELLLDRVTVPAGNMLLGEGRGFEIAQGRLGPGRLHHCMRAVGMGTRAFEVMARRALERRVFGGRIAAQGAFQSQLAQAHIKLQAARLLVLAAAHSLDVRGAKEARGEIAAAKVFAPNAVLEVIDAAIQVCGGAGVSNDLPLAQLWAQARTLRIADGPDDVHLASIAKLQLRRASKL